MPGAPVHLVDRHLVRHAGQVDRTARGPGLGAQGAQAADLAGAFHPGGTGALASASRGVQYAGGLDVQASVQAARAYRDELNAALGV